jgi:monoamine oxidase
MERLTAIVIGGGAAGFACAWHLQRRGKNILLLEAANSAGGRTRSRRDLIPNAVVELGAENVGANHPRWRQYADRFKFRLEEVVWPEVEVCHLGGNTYCGADLKQLYSETLSLAAQIDQFAVGVDAQRPWETPDAARLDLLSLTAGIDQLEGTVRAKRLLKHRFEFSEAASPDDISWLGQLAIIKGHGLHRYWEDTERYRCGGGVATLCEKFYRSLPEGSVQFGAPVVSVSYDSQGGEIEVADGRRFAASWIVLAVPPTQWPKIDFVPPLPAELRIAIGAASKEFCDFGPTPWAPSEGPSGRSDRPPGVIWPAQGPAVATRFISGPAAEASSLPDDNSRQAETRELLDRCAVTAGKPWQSRVVHDWCREPFVDGGYSYAQLGKATQFGDVLTKGIDRLLFAGEHCSFSFTGYVEGALEAGERASQIILQHIE